MAKLSKDHDSDTRLVANIQNLESVYKSLSELNSDLNDGFSDRFEEMAVNLGRLVNSIGLNQVIVKDAAEMTDAMKESFLTMKDMLGEDPQALQHLSQMADQLQELSNIRACSAREAKDNDAIRIRLSRQELRSQSLEWDLLHSKQN